VDTQSSYSTAGISGQRYFLSPSWGKDGSASGSGTGISIGTNGVSIYEHAPSYMPPVLVWQGEVKGWNHIALVYKNRQPNLYVNGVLIKTGVIGSKSPVSIAMGEIGSNVGLGGYVYGYFKGLVGETKIYNGALPDEEIKNQFETERSKYPTTATAATGEEIKSSAEPVLHLKFDEGKGGVVIDSSDYGNNGIVHNPKWITGKFGSALQFNGVDSYAQIPSSQSLDLTGDLTIELWTMPGALQVEYADILSKHGSYIGGFGLEQNYGQTNVYHFGW
jgi:hypothetical protein